jgi:hypothetical protein
MHKFVIVVCFNYHFADQWFLFGNLFQKNRQLLMMLTKHSSKNFRISVQNFMIDINNLGLVENLNFPYIECELHRDLCSIPG